MRAVQFARFGQPDVLAEVELPDPVAGPHEHLVEVEAAGVNFADIKQVAGEYAPPDSLPHVPGMEVAGRTEDGRRVLGYLLHGGYATKAVVASKNLVDIPEPVSTSEAVALLVQGLTAWHLLRSVSRLTCGETVVINAAAGGVGSLAIQLARQFGASRVIATASTEDKRSRAVSLGADVAVDGAVDGYGERVLDANRGRRVDIVLDATGGPMLEAAVGTLANFGRLVTYGASSGQVATPIESGQLAERSLSIAGFWLAPLLANTGAAGKPLTELLDLAAAGRVRPLLGGQYALAQAPAAHQDLLARRTEGKLILRPADGTDFSPSGEFHR
ncbi:quinone oxidoreductase family protein [Nocardia sp. NPDC004750]